MTRSVAGRGQGLAECARRLRAGELAVHPAETVYGFGGTLDPRPLEALRALKGRSSGGFVVLIPDPKSVEPLLGDAGRALARAFWPGPLTLVVEDRADRFPPAAKAPDGTVALRAPGREDTLALLREVGGPMTSTSANAPGGRPAVTVTEALAARLDLPAAATPWHAHRDRFAQLGCALGVATGAAGKIARDLALLAQTEVGEAAEGAAAGRGGSSTMPQKRNPVSASVTLAAAGRTPALVAALLGAMVQEHERGLGGWQVEWDVLPELALAAAGGARALAEALGTLSVDAGRMRANLESSGGALLAEAVAMTLAESLGKHEAHACVAAACRRAEAEGRPLGDVLAEDPAVGRHLDRPAIGKLLAPDNYLGASRRFIERVLAGLGDDA